MKVTSNRFLSDLAVAMEHTGADTVVTSTDPQMQEVQPGALSENMDTPVKDPTGNTGSPGDHDGVPTPDTGDNVPSDGDFVDADDESGNAGVPGDHDGDPAPATENFELPDFLKNVSMMTGTHVVDLEPARVSHDPSGHSDDPGDDGTPVSPHGDSKPDAFEKFIKKAMDPSGNPDSPGVNGDPVSKSGDHTPDPKSGYEAEADDNSGNPEGPGVDGTTDVSFESFIGACQRSMVRPRRQGSIYIPENMSLESYAMEIGLSVIVAQALEADLTAAEKRALPDSAFGLPKQRQYPLNDEAHVKSAIYNFHWCQKENQRELAKNIVLAIRKFGMHDVQVTEGNPFLKYYSEAVVVPRKKPAKA